MVTWCVPEDQRKQRDVLFQEIRKKIIAEHVKGYKTISKQFDTPVTTIAQKFKIQPVANLPGHGHRRKIDDKPNRIIRIVTKEPRKPSKEIKGELQAQETSV